MMESIKICRFKTFLEQCFEKKPPVPFSSKVETEQKMMETRSQNLTAIHRSSVKFRGGIRRFKNFA